MGFTALVALLSLVSDRHKVCACGGLFVRLCVFPLISYLRCALQAPFTSVGICISFDAVQLLHFVD